MRPSDSEIPLLANMLDGSGIIFGTRYWRVWRPNEFMGCVLAQSYLESFLLHADSETLLYDYSLVQLNSLLKKLDFGDSLVCNVTQIIDSQCKYDLR